MVTVPSAYQPYINEAAQGTGIPASVIAAQASIESGFNPGAISPTNAQGFWQFEPGTYNAYAAQSGVPANSEFNVADETKVYVTYMRALLQQEGGNLFNALAAYNAGPGNLQAGAGYASSILNNAGVSQASLTSFPLPDLPSLSNPLGPLNIGGDISNAFNQLPGNIGNSFLKAVGVPDLKDLLQRLGLIVLGAILIIVGVSLMGRINIEGVSVGGQPKVKENAVQD